MINIGKRNKIITVVAGIIIMIILISYFINKPNIEFVEKNPKIEIHTTFDAKKNIKKIKEGRVEDVKVDTTSINKDALGTYKVTYALKNDTYTIYVKVVDTKAPAFDIQDIDAELRMDIDPSMLVTNIVDDTKTKVFFKKKYTFDKEGKYEVIVVVKDEGENSTEKKAIVTLVNDQEKPTIEGVQEISVRKGGKIDFLTGVVAKDNCDPNPKIEVDSSKVDFNIIGDYQVMYTVTDRSGNITQANRTIHVIENATIGTSQQNSQKIVYLTFDDGPSANTEKILDILDRYHAKATFFVTGKGQEYNYLIKDAHTRGHTIGLHTYTHDYATVYSSTTAYFNDLDQVGKMVEGLIGYVPKYLRFPGGASNTVSRRYCPGIMSILSKEVINRGYQYYDWNAGTGDASGNNVPVASIIQQGIRSDDSNVMILAHDTQAKSTTVEALPSIIEHYQKLGYRFAGIDDTTFAPHQRVNN